MTLNVQMATVTGYKIGSFLGLGNIQILQVKIEDDNDATPVLLINPDGDESAPQNGERIPVITIGNFRISIGGLDGILPITSQGEKRLYSKDSSGNIAAYAYFDKDGNLEINGNADNAVAYTDLAAGLANQDTAINSELSKISTTLAAMVTAFAAQGYTITPYIRSNVTTDISAAKVDTVKLP